jgi:DNA repair exonuclease SbcCD ATPase subunit
MAETSAALTYEDVVHAAQLIASTGRKTSSVAVREKLGRGSFSTIRKHLDRWQIDQDPMTAPAAAPVPPQLESLWQEARREAERTLAVEQRAISQLSEQLDVRWTDMEAQIAAANLSSAHATQRLADKDAELARLVSQIDGLLEQRRDATAQVDALSKELARERDVGARRLDALERRIGELTRTLGALTEPLSAVPARISAVGDFVEAELGQMRKHLSTQQERDRAELRELAASSQALLSSLSDRLTAHIEQQRRAVRRAGFSRPSRGRSSFWNDN